jgi:glycosyltransferase involved in cell wall biosynthesis
MRILYYARSLAREGGTEISTLQVAQGLNARENSIDVVFERDGELRSDYAAFCTSLTHSHLSFPKPSLRASARIAPTVVRGIWRRPDVIYGHTFRDVICGRLTGVVARAPVVCHLRHEFRDPATPRLAQWADRYIAVSEATRRSWVNDGLDANRVEVVHSGIDPDLYPAGGSVERLAARRALGIPPDAFVALYYGRLDVDKGIDLLLEAWRCLAMPTESARLVLQGRPVLDPDPDRYLRHLRQQAPAGCHWLPMQDDIMSALHASDVVVMPSVTEGLSRTVLEAMAAGRPVIATRVGGVPEIMTGPFSRFLFDSGDTDGLVKQLSAIVGWREREPDLGSRCSRHIRANFSLTTMADRIDEILREEANRRSSELP